MTDCEFWLNRTGAQQRILTLVRFLAMCGADVRVLFAGQLSTTDDAILANEVFHVEALFDNRPPSGVVNRFVWHLKGTVYWFRSCLRNGSRGESKQKDSKHVSEFYSHALMKRFQSMLTELRPDSVIVEYVSMAYLMMSVSTDQRESTRFLIDTHDVMHSRCVQFQSAGFEHWIDISESEESALLDEFDTVLAITDQEREEFQSMVKSAKPIVVGHPMTVQRQTDDSKTERVSIGYFASDNASNESAVDKLIQDVWPRVLRSVDADVELIIAGGICKRLQGKSFPKCQMLGVIDEPSEFYDRVHIVVNPVEFGTGLKIKNLEALAFSKCLVTTKSGSKGMPGPWKDVLCEASMSDAFAATLIDLIRNPTRRNELSQAAKKYVEEELSPSVVYKDLLDELSGDGLQSQNVLENHQNSTVEGSYSSGEE